MTRPSPEEVPAQRRPGAQARRMAGVGPEQAAAPGDQLAAEAQVVRVRAVDPRAAPVERPTAAVHLAVVRG
jgi:hypothetical protein